MAGTRGRREPRFYVYQFVDYDGNVLYIGKGVGRRLEAQQRRFAMKGHLVRWFHSEKAAFDFEARLIAKHKPVHNKIAGGGGAITRKKLGPVRMDPVFYEIERLGTRLYVVKMLNRMDTRGYLTDEQRRRNLAIEIELESTNQKAAA